MTATAIVYEDGGYAWVCDMCGQLLPVGEECNSGYHVGLSGETKGKPIRSDVLAGERRDARARAESLEQMFSIERVKNRYLTEIVNRIPPPAPKFSERYSDRVARLEGGLPVSQ